jgi:Flp pilus assembly protein TadG
MCPNETLIRRRSRASRYVRKARSGTTLVEMALVSPIILILFIGAVEITQLNFLRHTAANAAYEGARRAIVPGGTASDAQTEALALLTLVGIANGASVTVSQVPERVQVTVSIPASQNSWGLNTFSAGCQVVQACTLMRENTD